MRYGRVGLAALFFTTATVCFGADVVVLRGGTRIDLKEPLVQQGNTAILTRADGTLFSVPMAEIDWKATAALRSSKPEAPKPAIVAPPSAPTDAVRTAHAEKARVRVTDADVGHAADPTARFGDKEKSPEMRANAPRVEVLDYNQQKSGTNLVVTGQLQNPGTTPVFNVRLAVSAIDDEGTVSTASATLATGTIEGGRAVSFSATIPVGEKNITQVRFAPQWMTPPTPAPASAAAPPASGAAASAASAPAAKAPASPPAPAPTPYGQGSLYAAPAASAPMTAPADGKSGYIPGASSPENQPKAPQ